MRRSRRRLEPAAAVPLLSAYLGLAALYAWQAWERLTPTLFSDEIELTQVSRSIAETGRAALRGGEPAPGASLYAYATAPSWWLDDVSDAYGVAKLIGVLLMTSAIFPAYALARMVVARPYALFAAVATAAAPALSYAPFLVEEPMAYPAAALAFWLIARAGVAPTWASVGLAAGACFLGALVRAQLAVLLPVLLLVLAARLWDGRRVSAWRTTWSRGDWLGAVVLVTGAAVLFSAAAGRYSTTWYVSTAFFKGRMLEYGLWAAGALAIGIGILPFVAGLAAIVRPRQAASGPAVRGFATLVASAAAAFGMYTAVKAAYLSTTLAIVVAERNLIYLYPLLFAGTALVLERRAISIPALAAATAFALYLVATTPYTLAQYPNYEAHGLAIAALANRILRWPDETIEVALALIAVGSAAVLLALALAPWRRAAVAGTAVVAALVIAWSLTTEIYAANGERYASDQIYANLPKPPDWIDRTTGGGATIYVGQGIDAFAAWQVEFWNPSVRWFWGMDGSAPGPGERRTPNLLRPDGTQDPADLNAQFAVAVNGVAIAAPKVTEVGGAVLYRLGGAPVRLTQASAGVAPDGWMGNDASYTRYDVEPGTRGFVKVTFSRQGACFPQLEATRVSARVGPVIVDDRDQPAIGETTARSSGSLEPCEIAPLLLPVPSRPWRVEAHVEETFVPRELDSNLGDARALGAVVSFEVVQLG